MSRGRLGVYLGAAPGVGKTFAMLNEGWRRRERGTDVIVGLVETHGRPMTTAQLQDLEVVPRRVVTCGDRISEELDVEAILARSPEVVLIDELAHTNGPGSPHAKRWEDVGELLDRGIEVVSTVNLQHLESVNDLVAEITGVVERETIPDTVVRRADRIELVDMAPDSLRRRLAHGNVYPAEQFNAALANFFRPGNLAALRELALLWLADRVEEDLRGYRDRHHIRAPWETKERVAVSLTGAPGGDSLVRRAARMAARSRAELIGVHVRADRPPAASRRPREAPAGLAAHRQLLEQLGGRYIEVAGGDIARSLVRVAGSENATQLVLGASRQSRWSQLTRGSVVNRAIRAAAGDLDVHVIGNAGSAPDHLGGPRARMLTSPVPWRRQAMALALCASGLPLLTFLLVVTDHGINTDLGLPFGAYLLTVVAVAELGGLWPAIAAAAASSVLLDYYFAGPNRGLTVTNGTDVVTLVAFLVTACIVATLVHVTRWRSLSAAHAADETRALARAAARVATGADSAITDLLDEILVTFGQRGAAVVRATDELWQIDTVSGDAGPLVHREVTASLPLGGDRLLVVHGQPMSSEDIEVLSGFAAQMGAALESRRLHGEAVEAEQRLRGDELRAALLAAVSHDLRTPLASVKAAATSLLSEDVTFGPEEVRALLETVDSGADRLDGLVENLLDMSRIQSGSLEVAERATSVGEVVEAAVSGLGDHAANVVIEIEASIPQLRVDPVLLERALANLVENALVHGCPSSAGPSPVRIQASAVPGGIVIRVVDRGQGILRSQRDLAFRPFQRLDDRGGGVGLGLAVANGFVSVMGGELTIEDTPGGGCTMAVALPTAKMPHAASPATSPGVGSGIGAEPNVGAHR